MICKWKEIATIISWWIFSETIQLNLTNDRNLNMTLENISTAIETLKAINHKEELAYEKAFLAFLSIKHMPILILEIPKGLEICRSRPHDTSDFFYFISDFTNPPSQSVKNFARCNRPFQSKFYCSDTLQTSFIELAENWAETKHAGDKLYVTTGFWCTKKALQSIIVLSPDKINRTSTFDKEHGKALDFEIEKYNGEFKEAMILFYRFLFDIFRVQAKNNPLAYIIATAYSNLSLLKLDGQANCIFYPSVPFMGQGINFAINADFIGIDNIELQTVICNEMAVSMNEFNKHEFTESKSWTAKQLSNIDNEITW